MPLDLRTAATAPFERAAAHRLFDALAGRWEGPTRTFLEPTAPAVQSVTYARFERILGGRFLRMEYRSELQGKPHAGEWLVAFERAEARCQTAWVDSFHTGTGMIQSTGTVDDEGVLEVLGSYAAGETRWGWRTRLALEAGDSLVLRSFNLSPEGVEDLAIETHLSRLPDLE